MSRILILGQEEKRKLNMLKKHAEQNVVSMDHMLDVFNKQSMPVGDIDGFKCIIPDGFAVVFSHDKYSEFTTRHISVSCPGKGRVPSIPVVQLLMKELGFVADLDLCKVYFEDAGDRKAINVVEKI